MKKIIVSWSLLFACIISFGATAQMSIPALSPLGKVEQTVGITSVSIEYSRPSKKNRRVFPEVVPYGEIWRTGANKNTIIRFDKPIQIQRQEVPAGEYSIFVIPERDRWTVFFYKGTEYRGVPENWDDKSIVLKTEARVKEVRDIETFTISIDDITLNSASLVFSWDHVSASVPFTVLDSKIIEEGIRKTLKSSNKASDFYQAADYYVNSKGDMRQALEWINKALKIGEGKAPYWYFSRKVEILANIGDFKQAVETAEQGMKKAEAARDEHYMQSFRTMIETYSNKR